MKPQIPSDVYMRLYDIPVTHSARKRCVLIDALNYYTFKSWQIEELKEQWAYAVPHTSFPNVED
jgi:hypothetical protein